MELKNNKVLTELQKSILIELFNLTDEFYLTGGTALSAFYLSHRYSIDLDLFTKEEKAFKNSALIINKVCKALQKDMSIRTDTFYFKHFNINDKESDEILTLHFSFEVVEQFSECKNRFDKIIVDTIEEILINKICCIISRSEVKDLIDLFFLEKENYDIFKYIPYAQRKDGGIEKEILAYCLNNINTEFEDRILIKKVTKKQLVEFKEKLVKNLLVEGE